jgi:hypothetical protein
MLVAALVRYKGQISDRSHLRVATTVLNRIVEARRKAEEPAEAVRSFSEIVRELEAALEAAQKAAAEIITGFGGAA